MVQDEFSGDYGWAILVNLIKLKIPDTVWKITNSFDFNNEKCFNLHIEKIDPRSLVQQIDNC